MAMRGSRGAKGIKGWNTWVYEKMVIRNAEDFCFSLHYESFENSCALLHVTLEEKLIQIPKRLDLLKVENRD
jgi:hypothetical protein